MRPVNQATVDLIKTFEGCRLKSYQDSVGVWTIGYGHTLGVSPGETIPQTTAELWLRQDLDRAGVFVESVVEADLTDNQFGALVSFVFNLGGTRLSGSTLLKLLNQGDFAGAADEFLKWDHAGGQVVPGLLKRREFERELFLK